MAAHETAWESQRCKHYPNYGTVIIIVSVCAAIFFTAFAIGYCMRIVNATDKSASIIQERIRESIATQEPSESTTLTTEEALWRDDIVTDGNFLDYDLQVTMQVCCEEYSVPYALALAVADVESRFDPYAVSGTA